MSLSAPLKLDNRSLLFWIRYCDDPQHIPMKLYDELEVVSPEYKELRENTALFDRLRTLLELNELVEQYHQTLKEISPLRRIFSHRKTRAIIRQQDELEDNRKRAHEAYEMLRRLSYGDGEGAMFIIEFD